MGRDPEEMLSWVIICVWVEDIVGERLEARWLLMVMEMEEMEMESYTVIVQYLNRQSVQYWRSYVRYVAQVRT